MQWLPVGSLDPTMHNIRRLRLESSNNDDESSGNGFYEHSPYKISNSKMRREI
jgi:hypothetical protein